MNHIINRNLKMLLCWVTVVLLCFTALVGCARDKDESPDSDTAQSDTVPDVTQTDSETTVFDADTLGEHNFNGARYNILARETSSYEWDSNSTLGTSTVNNAIYMRNESVEDRFNVNIAVEVADGAWKNTAADCPWYSKYETSTMSGWNSYSMITGHFAMTQRAAVAGLCYDLGTLDAIDMRKEWWSDQFYEACNLDGRLYVAVGDIGYSLYEGMEVVFFNETMAENLLKDSNGDPIDLYQLVRDEEWTWENMKKYVLMVNDTDFTDNNDKEFGLLAGAMALRLTSVAFEVSFAESDNSRGYTVYSFPESAIARDVKVIDDVDLFFENEAANSVWLAVGDANGNKAFSEGRGLFYMQMLGQLPKFGEAMAEGQSYGILPYPMYDGDQFEYHTGTYDGISGISVPKNIQDPKLSGLVTEALCMYGYQEVRPVYLDTVLNGRYLAGGDMKEMMDLIRESYTLPFMYAYGPTMGSPNVYALTDSIYTKNSVRYGTVYANNFTAMTTNIGNFYKSYGVMT